MELVNLSGCPSATCDEVIRRELRRARITPELVLKREGDVSTFFIGKLGLFTFVREAQGWLVVNEVPLKLALRLHQDPVVLDDFRILYCKDVVHPLTVARLTEQAHVDMMSLIDGPTGHVERIAFQKADEAVKAAIAGKEWNQLAIDGYHIKTEIGLRVFVELYVKWEFDGGKFSDVPDYLLAAA